MAGVVGLLALVATACGDGTPDTSAGGTSDASGTGGTVRVYTTVTQDTVDAVVALFEDANPGVEVEVFRAPTGEVNARIAAERREGGLRADVLWLTDPLSMLQFESDGLLRSFEPEGIDAIPGEFRTAASFGTRVLNIVLVHQAALETPPTSWQDLTRDLGGPVAVPDPGFAGSAFAALGWFAADADHGFAFLEDLAAAGAVQVQSPGDAVTGVAEGLYAAGLTLDRTARAAVDNGSPIDFLFPEPGAIALYSPIAVVEGSTSAPLAEAFAAFSITPEAQQAIAGTGWQPIRDDVDWPHPTTPAVTVDWEAAFADQADLLERWRAIVGG